MSRIRLSIASVMIVMIPLAIGLTALRSASQLWVNTVFNLVVAVLLIATYKAKSTQGIAGAGWVGFATFGWAHLVLGLVGMPFAQHYGIEPALVTSEITERVVALMEHDQSVGVMQRVIGRGLVVHCLVSLGLSLLGGALFSAVAARHMSAEQARRQRDESPPSD